MLKKKIVIASVLKPLNDARMYEKFGISLAKDENHEVHIIGYPSPIPHHEKIIFHPLKKFYRISFARVRSYWEITKILGKVKPEIIIVNTVELLLVGLLNKIIFGSKLLYDVQENYYRNIRYQENFPTLIKYILAPTVRLIEKTINPFVDHKFLAEEKYREEMSFTREKSTIILNKYNPIHFKERKKEEKEEGKIRLLYTGTVSKSYGILEGIDFYKALRKHSYVTLTVIGHCTDKELFKNLYKETEKDGNLIVNVALEPIPHQQIEACYSRADFAIAPYPRNKSTENCIPVKFYEYLAYQLPIIIPDHNSYWIDFLTPHTSFIALNFNDFDPSGTIHNMKEKVFYTKEKYPDVFWETEEKKLLKVVVNILTKE